jgi:hypothetical protein
MGIGTFGALNDNIEEEKKYLEIMKIFLLLKKIFVSRIMFIKNLSMKIYPGINIKIYH